MTLRHLRIFVSVCENGCNTTKAAAALHMTQPAVSLAIKELEQYYGIVLFDRIGRRLSITEAGEQVKSYALSITALFDDMEKGIKNWDSFGVLRIGASITIGSQFLPTYVKAFSKQYPNTEVRVVVRPSEQLEEKILNNELDFALIEGVSHHPSLICEPYMDDELTVICPANGKYRPGQTLSIDEFRTQKFLLREKGSGTRETFDRTVEAVGFSVVPLWEAMSTAALVNAVINGLGIAVLPRRMVDAPIKDKTVIAVRVEGLEFLRKFHILYHREKFLTSSARAFIRLCKEDGKLPVP